MGSTLFWKWRKFSQVVLELPAGPSPAPCTDHPGFVFPTVCDGLCFSDHPVFTEPRSEENEYCFQLFWICRLLGFSLSHLRADWKFQKTMQVIPGCTRPNTCTLLCSNDMSYPGHGSPQAALPVAVPTRRQLPWSSNRTLSESPSLCTCCKVSRIYKLCLEASL